MTAKENLLKLKNNQLKLQNKLLYMAAMDIKRELDDYDMMMERSEYKPSKLSVELRRINTKALKSYSELGTATVDNTDLGMFGSDKERG